MPLEPLLSWGGEGLCAAPRRRPRARRGAQGKEACLKELQGNPELAKEIEAKIREVGVASLPEEPPSDGEDFEGSESAIDLEIASEEGH